jgi:lipoprotein-releasing system ATP-binding protein
LGTGSAIWAESLTKTFCSGVAEVTVFRELSFQVCPGERLAIIGESGAGKSTLLHLLGGLDRPTSGSIFYEGRDIVRLGEQDLAEFRSREVGFVWQNPSLLPEFTALENVSMPLLIRGVKPDRAAETALARLDEVGLSARRAHRAGELSGGEQQRVALARALAAEPKVLLADEPTGNLDFRTGETIIKLLNDLHQAHRLTSVFVTHNLSFAARCDRVLELDKGFLHTPSVMELQEAGIVQDATRLGGGTYV